MTSEWLKLLLVLSMDTHLVDPLVLVWFESCLVNGNVLVDVYDLIRWKRRHGGRRIDVAGRLIVGYV